MDRRGSLTDEATSSVQGPMSFCSPSTWISSASSVEREDIKPSKNLDARDWLITHGGLTFSVKRCVHHKDLLFGCQVLAEQTPGGSDGRTDDDVRDHVVMRVRLGPWDDHLGVLRHPGGDGRVGRDVEQVLEPDPDEEESVEYVSASLCVFSLTDVLTS